MANYTRFCGRPVRTIAMWFALFDIVISVVGLVVVPFLITDKAKTYFGFGVFSVIYYVFSLIFSTIGFYGAYKLFNLSAHVFAIWQPIALIFYLSSYIISMATTQSTCQKMHKSDSSSVDECSSFAYGVMITAFFIVITLRVVYCIVAFRLVKAIKKGLFAYSNVNKSKEGAPRSDDLRITQLQAD